jgi:hypothetical protein
VSEARLGAVGEAVGETVERPCVSEGAGLLEQRSALFESLCASSFVGGLQARASFSFVVLLMLVGVETVEHHASLTLDESQIHRYLYSFASRG